MFRTGWSNGLAIGIGAVLCTAAAAPHEDPGHAAGMAQEVAATPGAQSPHSRAERLAFGRALITRSASDLELLESGIFERLLTELQRRGAGHFERLERADVLELLRMLGRLTNIAEIRAQALLTEGRVLLSAMIDAGDFAAARSLFEQIRAAYPGSPAAHEAGDELWRMDHLAVGCLAPNFVTLDVYGNEIRLSDYIGQVVVVDFWGYWEAGSNAAVAHRKRLARRHWDDRFVLLGVNSDSSPSGFIEAADRDGLTWTNAWEGSLTGPVAAAWRVRTWPTTILLDAFGVVRAIGLEGAELERAVGGLLEELRPRFEGLPRSGPSAGPSASNSPLAVRDD